MRTAILLTPFLLNLALLASCSSPPKPPTVDEAAKRPANSAVEIQLQMSKSELQNTRLLVSELTRRAEDTAAALATIAARQQALAELRRSEPPVMQSNVVFTVRFGYGSTRLDMPADAEKVLIAHARSAPLVMLRGRTDGATDSPAESRVARGRAAAVRDFLVAAGIDASRIRATYQPTGDHVADNAGASGQALNRRVEIELYGALPVALDPSH